MKKQFITLIFLLLVVKGFAQEDTPDKPKEKDLPVREPFLSTLVIDNQTTFIPVKKTFEFVIQHKFGEVNNGLEDLFGLYAPGASVRLGGHYVPIKNLQIGYGLSKIRMYNDFSIKYTLLEQTRKNTIPVALSLYGNMAIDGRNKDDFGSNYNFGNRLSYFTQLIISRKFGERATIQANSSFTHYNQTDPAIDHDKISVGINGRIVINYKYSVLFQYDVPLELKNISEHQQFINHPYPNFGIGWEIRTSAHVFHLFATSSEAFLPQHNHMYNRSNWLKNQLRFGFTITRLYNFM